MWLPYLYARWLFWLIVGILWEIWGNGYQTVGFYGLIVSALGYALSFWFLPARWQVKYTWIMGVFASLTLINFGVVLTHGRIERYSPQHFLHTQNIEAYTAQIVQEPQEKTKSYRAVAEIEAVRRQGKWERRQGKVLLYLRKETGNFKKLRYGDIYVIKGSPQVVPPPSNPAMFDFREYLAYQQVYHQQFLTPSEVKFLRHSIPNYILYVAIYLRQKCVKTLQNLVVGERESALAVALVLGIKDDVEPEILEAYTVTGLMHILAVSGMHVGLLVWLPMLWFRRNKSKGKPWQKAFFVWLMIGLLFFYALLTGLSASILRAVVMFSTLLIGQWWNKRGNSYNILAFSAFLLLLYEPFWVLSVGFQLSYLAVLGIFYIQPKMNDWITPNTRIMREIWGITTVTIAAQIATTPIGLFYFHQFPNYFLLSNLLALPLSTIVLYLVLATLGLGWIPYIGEGLGWCASWGIWFTNQVIFWVQKMPYQLTDGIWFEWWEVLFLYGFIVFVLMTWGLRKTRYWAMAFMCLFLFTSSRFYRYTIQSHQKMLVAYHIGKYNNLAIFSGHQAYVIADSTLQTDTKTYNFNIKNHLFRQGILKPTYITKNTEKTPHFLLKQTPKYALVYFAGKISLILKQKMNQSELAHFEEIDLVYCFLQNKALYSLQDWQGRVGKFVVCPSNPKYYAQRLKKEADSLKIPIHLIAEQGAFVNKF